MSESSTPETDAEVNRLLGITANDDGRRLA